MRTRHLAPLCLALALSAAACDDGDGGSSEPDTTTAADTASGDTTSGDTATGDTITGDTATGDTTPGDTIAGDTTTSDTATADTTAADTATDVPLCDEVHEQFYCDAPMGELESTTCAAPDVALYCELRTSPDGCHRMGVWLRTDCAAGEVCADGEGCVAAPDPTRGTCTSDADCPDGSACLEVVDDEQGRSWRTCSSTPPEAEACVSQEGFDECCASAECTAGPGGGCFTGPLFYCGGAFPQPMNVCLYDECASDADCAQTDPPTSGVELCLPRGAFGEPRGRCDTSSTCRLDEDCTSLAGGQCLPFFSPCSGRFAGFHCTYDESPCRSDADCTDGRYCAPGPGGATRCEDFVPPP